MKIISLSILFFVVACFGVFAQQNDSAVSIFSPFPIKLNWIATPADNHGTDVANIHTLSIDFADPQYANNYDYTIVYFEDGQPREEFKNEPLPFELKRNYKGLPAGNHVIKIDVEDGKGTVLASSTITVQVKTQR